ncbi:MAG: hypothetical protein WDO73_00430 [Ignavibacteriota bacterium]
MSELPRWPRSIAKADYHVPHVSAAPKATADAHRTRDLVLDSIH